MNEIKLNLDENGKGSFKLLEGDEQIGEMGVVISGNDLTVDHTEIDPKFEGQGYAKKLLTEMVQHARSNKLKVIPLCPYVHAQFKRHLEEYKDVWKGKS